MMCAEAGTVLPDNGDEFGKFAQRLRLAPRAGGVGEDTVKCCGIVRRHRVAEKQSVQPGLPAELGVSGKPEICTMTGVEPPAYVATGKPVPDVHEFIVVEIKAAHNGGSFQEIEHFMEGKPAGRRAQNLQERIDKKAFPADAPVGNGEGERRPAG